MTNLAPGNGFLDGICQLNVLDGWINVIEMHESIFGLKALVGLYLTNRIGEMLGVGIEKDDFMSSGGKGLRKSIANWFSTDDGSVLSS